jgi:hypothetical protein
MMLSNDIQCTHSNISEPSETTTITPIHHRNGFIQFSWANFIPIKDSAAAPPSDLFRRSTSNKKNPTDMQRRFDESKTCNWGETNEEILKWNKKKKRKKKKNRE